MNGIGLLKDFFEHEMVEAALFDGFDLQLQLMHFGRNLDIVQVADDQSLFPMHDRHFFVVQVDDVLSVFYNRGSVRSNEVFIFGANTNDQRTRLSRRHQQIRHTGVHYDNGISSFDFAQCNLNRFTNR